MLNQKLSGKAIKAGWSSEHLAQYYRCRSGLQQKGVVRGLGTALIDSCASTPTKCFLALAGWVQRLPKPEGVPNLLTPGQSCAGAPP